MTILLEVVGGQCSVNPERETLDLLLLAHELRAVNPRRDVPILLVVVGGLCSVNPRRETLDLLLLAHELRAVNPRRDVLNTLAADG